VRARIVALAAAAVCVFSLPNAASAGPELSVSPPSLTFGEDCVGAPTAAGSVVVTNSGDADVHVSSVSVGGDAAGDYTVAAGPMPRTLAAGQAMTIKVTFIASATGARNASMEISSDAPSSPATVALSGSGVTRTLQVNPTQLSFGDQRVGQSSDPLALSLASTGSSAVTISKVSLTGTATRGFSVGTPSQTTIAPGEDTSVPVVFRPRSTGTQTAAVTIESNACAGRTSIQVTGNGTAPKIAVSPSPVNGGTAAAGLSADPIPVVFSNAGKAPLRITDISIDGAQSSDFRFDAFPDLPKVLGPGEQFLVNMTFHPSTSAPESALLRVTSDDPSRPSFSVQLVGNSGSPVPAASPTDDATDTASPSSSPSEQTLAASKTGSSGGGGAGDWVSVVVVMVGVGGVFGALFFIRHRRALEA
jgi:hypothetical protein